MNQSLQFKRYVGLWGAVVATLLCVLVTMPEAAAQRGRQRRSGKAADGKVSEGWLDLYEPQADDEMPYRLMKPIHFDSNKRYPVIVSLHGGGGTGTDNRKQLRGWNRLLAEEQRRSDYPCYVLAPQADHLWDADHLKKIKDIIAALPSVDMDRIYILGHSMRGHGTNILIQIDPGYFAAAAPSAGSGLTRTEDFIDAAVIKDIPIWAFHGDNDRVCPYERDRKLFLEMQELEGNMKLTTWAGDGHGIAEKMITGADNGSTQLSSDRCDPEPDFMKWLFSRRRPPVRNRGQQDRPRKLNRGAGVPQEIIDAYEARVLDGLPYRLLLPADFEAGRKYPLILNLHGGGGVGNDNRSNLRDWSAKFVDAAWRAKYPCIVVTPQAAGSWSVKGEVVPVLTEAMKKKYSEAWQARLERRNYPPGPMSDGPLSKAFALIDHLAEEFAVDTNRVYVLGHSMGGAGSWNAVWAAPERFAAAIPSAGGLLPWKDAAKFKDVPIWAFHGGSDPVVPTDFSRDLFARMKQVGGNLKYTELKGVKHNASQYAFYYEGDEPEKGYVTQYSSERCDKTANVWDWLFAQRLDNAPQYNPFGETLKGNKNSTLNMHLLPEGEFDVDRDKWGDIVRVNTLKIRDFSRVPGVKKAWIMKGYEGEEGMAFHPVISEIKDVDGDGKLDIFRCRSEHQGAKIERLRYDDGVVVWESEPMAALHGDESRLPVFDLDGDGVYSVLHATKGGTWCINAKTGKTEWSVKEAVGDIIVGHFLERKRQAVVIRSDGTLRCYDEKGKLTWKHETGLKGGDAYAHEAYRHDADGDGLDEVFANWQKLTMALSGDGSVLWEDKTQRHHSDYLVCADVDADGKTELIYDHEGCGGSGPTYIVDAMSGKIKVKIDYRKDGLSHAQNMAVGDFDPSRKGLEIAMCGKQGNLFVWDATGTLLWKRAVPSSLLSKGDWDGDGVEDISCHALGANVDGMFSVWNGKGERLYAISFLPSPSRRTWSDKHNGGSWSHAMPGGHEGVRRQVDLDGNGHADFIMPFGAWHWGSDSVLFLMEGSSKKENW